MDSYNRAVGSLERKVLPGARKFTELGIHPKKELESVEPLESLPRTMIEDSQIDDVEPLRGENDEDAAAWNRGAAPVTGPARKPDRVAWEEE